MCAKKNICELIIQRKVDDWQMYTMTFWDVLATGIVVGSMATIVVGGYYLVKYKGWWI